MALSFVAINIVGAALFLGGDAGLMQIVRNSVISVMSFSLTPIPLFILMGEILFHTGLAINVIDGVERLIRQVPGRLAVIAVVAGTVFSAISGSTIATTAMLGSLMLPVMLARGYRPAFATGPIMAIGAVDMLIPPSALTVLLGSLSGISISKLLIGGVVPGLILSVAFVAYIIVAAILRPEWAPPAPAKAQGASGWRLLVLYVLPLVSIFVVVVGAMSGGWATPTESAALGALATMGLALLYRALTLEALMKSLKGTVAITGMILFIILGATTFSQILSFSGATDGLVAAILGQGLSPFAILIGMMALLIFSNLWTSRMMLIATGVHADRAAARHRPDWFGVLLDLHAARLATAARSADDHERRVTARGDDGRHLPRRRALCRDEHPAAGPAALAAGNCHLAAEPARLRSAKLYPAEPASCCRPT